MLSPIGTSLPRTNTTRGGQRGPGRCSCHVQEHGTPCEERKRISSYQVIACTRSEANLPSSNRKAVQADLVQGASQRRQSVEKEQMSGCHILARGDTYARLGAGKDNRGPSDQGRLVIRKTPCPARKIVSGVREHKIVDQRDQGRAVIRGSLPGAEKPCRARNR